MRYYIEVHENGHRLPKGNPFGYDTLNEAKEDAKRYVDDALPSNTVAIMARVATAYFGGDGGTYVREEQ